MKYLMFNRSRFKNIYSGFAGILFLAITLLATNTCAAQGDLLLYPKRIIFDGYKRSQEINLANSGKDTARYILSVIQIRMKEDGTFETITEPDPGQNFADRYFRIFPRNVVLPPNEAQTVKIQLTNTGELQPGEYRSHLYVRAEAEKKPLGEEETTSDSASISVKLMAVFGISIPVIIRSGDNNATVSISDVTFQQGKDMPPALKFMFNRNGNMSVYGDVTVDYTSTDGKVIRVGTANGLAIYTPTNKRIFNLTLNNSPGIDYHKGSLQIVYNYGTSKEEKLAKGRMDLQ